MPDAQSQYDALAAHLRETAMLDAAESLLAWDERTKLPSQGSEFRAAQLGLLAGMIHARRTDPRMGEWLAAVEDSDLVADPESDAAAVVREVRRDYDKQTKLPQRLVAALAEAVSLGQSVWAKARQENDYAAFRPRLETNLRLRQEYADAIGHEGERYDALLDDYEPDAKTAQIDRVLAALREDLVPLVAAIADSGREAPHGIVSRSYPIDAQRRIGVQAATLVGYDFSRGRIDETDHPFCSGMGPHDCRITTRYDERHFNGAFFGTLHEAGHGMYEQGLPAEHYGLPLGQSVSLGIHESQSRLWENGVGRSRAFWDHFYPTAQAAFPEALSGVSVEEFHFAVNDVRPSLIRVEADEATYNLHIVIRFELERELLSGALSCGDLPEAWNARYEQYLGIRPPSDAVGVMQDVHWSAALFGYFPTYSLGNIYAAQFLAQAERELGSLDASMRAGAHRPLLDWLREKIHRHGRRYSAAELVQRITGGPLDHRPLISQLREKFGALYGI